MRAARALLVVIVAVLVPQRVHALCGSVPPYPPQPPELAEELPDVDTSSSLIVDKVIGLECDPVRIYEFVRNEFRHELYFGLLKGPTGTLMSGGGNAYDLSALLVSLLRTAGYRARFARGRISLTLDQARSWLGTELGQAPAAPYAPTLSLLQAIEPRTSPHDWRTNSLGVGAYWNSTESKLWLLHVWVETQVPLARYRGAGTSATGAGSAGMAWVPLDAAFKGAEWRPNPELPIGTPELTFDYGLAPLATSTPSDSYYRRVHSRLPHELFENQVRDYLATNRPGTSLEHLALRGPIRRLAPGVLPTGLPYKFAYEEAVLAVHGPPVRSPSLIPLHATPPNGGSWEWSGLAGAIGAPDYRFRSELKLCNESPDPVSCVNGASIISVGDATAALDGKRSTLTFPPQDPADLAELPDGYAGAPCSTMTVPTITIEGQGLLTGPGRALCGDPPLQLVLVLRRPQDPPANFLSSSHRVAVGGTYAASWDAHTASPQKTEQAVQKMLQALEQNPITLDVANNNRPFIDIDGDGARAPPTIQECPPCPLGPCPCVPFSPGEPYLSQDFNAQEGLSGSLLHLAAARYYERLNEGLRRIHDLHHTLPLVMPAAGLASAGAQVDYLLDVPFSVRPSQLLIDIQATQVVQLTRQGLPVLPPGSATHLAGHLASALEHTVWEEVGSFDAVSTVKGFQLLFGPPQPDMALIKNDIEVAVHPQDPIVIKSDADAVYALGQYCPAQGPSCQSMDSRAYCAIRQGWRSATDPGWDSWPGDAPCSGTASGTLELRIAPWPNFRYKGFRGVVWYERRLTPSSISEAYTIAETPEAAGGGKVADPCAVTIPWRSPCAIDRGIQYNNFAASQLSAGTIGNYVLDNVPGLQRQETHSFRSGQLFTPYAPDWDRLVVAGDPVSVVSGGYYSQDTDIAIAGPGGFDLRLVRSYNSRLDYDGPLGHGWIHTFDQHLRIDRGDPADETDDHVIWVREDASETVFEERADGSLVGPAWGYDDLERNMSTGAYTLTTKSGVVLKFLAEASGRSRLDFVRDRNGNEISCVYASGRLDRVLDAAGRTLQFSYDVASGKLQRIEDWTGRRWEYTVLGGDLVHYRDPELVAAGPGKLGWKYEYLSGQRNEELNHNLRRWMRPRGRTATSDGEVWMEFEYYADDTVYRHISSKGEVTTFSYNYVRRVTSVENPDGSQEQYFFDAFGNVTRHESRRGVVREYEFDGRRNRVAEIDGLGFRTEAVYDDRGNMLRRTDRLENDETWTYNAFGQTSSHHDRDGRMQRLEYDSAGNLVAELAHVDGRFETLRELRYDERGNPIETVEYTEPGRAGARLSRLEIQRVNSVPIALKRRTDALGNSVYFSPDALGRPTGQRTIRSTRTQPATETVATETSYDRLDRPMTVTDPAGLISRAKYDENGLVKQRCREPTPTAACGSGSILDETNVYDQADRLVQTTNALGHSTLFEYDAQGRRTRTITPLGRQERREHDLDGNPVAVTDPAGGVTRTQYDAEGRTVQVTDPENREVRSEYDAEGRLLRSWQELDADTAVLHPYSAATDQRLLMEVLWYDAEGHALRVRDAAGRIVETTYDDFGRPETVRAPLQLVNPTQPQGDLQDIAGTPSSTTQFAYDLQGRLVSKRIAVEDTLNRTTTVGYDVLGRVTRVTDPLQRSRYFRYDEVGNVVETQNGAGERVTLRYDARGLLLERRYTDPTAGELADTFAYDRLGRQTLAKNTTATRTIEYDALDRPTALFDATVGTARRTYDRDGRVVQVVYPDSDSAGFPAGVVQRIEYDPRGLVARIADPEAGSWGFAYDGAGRPIRQRGPAGLERTTTYTPEGWVREVKTTRAGATLEYTRHDQFDLVGNPLQIVTTESATATTVSYDAMDRVKSVAHPTGESETFTYDRAGNRKTHARNGGSARIYGLDAADQVTLITAPVELFVHDNAGRRITRTLGGAVTTYAYDPLGRLRTLSKPGYAMSLDYDALGTRARRTEGAAVSEYFGEWMERRGGETIRLIHGSGIDHVLAEVTGFAKRHLVTDAGGNVQRVEVDDFGSFEADAEAPTGAPDGWNMDDPNTSDSARWTLETTHPFGSGQRSMKLDVPSQPADPFNLKISRSATVRPGTYQLSACFYVESATTGGNVQVTGPGGVSVYSDNTYPSQWRCPPASAPFEVTSPGLVPVYARLNSGTGRVFVDNVKLERVESATPPAQEPTREEIRRYEAFGSVRTSQGGAAGVERGFAGRPTEGASGLLYLRARHYDPATGRFLQSDPLGIDTDQLYAYAASNPYGNNDPTGFRPSSLSPNLWDFASARAAPARESLLPDVLGVHALGAAFNSSIYGRVNAVNEQLLARGDLPPSLRFSLQGQLLQNERSAEQLAVLTIGVQLGLGLAGDLATLPVVQGAARAMSSARTATTLYRAVSHAEAADLTEFGAFRPGPNSFATGKWFAESAEHATEWGSRLYPSGDFQIVEAQLQRSAAGKLMRLERLDGIGPARFGTFEQIEGASIRVRPR